MNGTLGRDAVWNQQTWTAIDRAVREEVGRIRVAQKVFPSIILPGGEPVPADTVLPSRPVLTMEEGRTSSFAEIWVEFSLTPSQILAEDRLHTGKALATLAASKLAMAEDNYLFQGTDWETQQSFAALKACVQARNAASLGSGLLGKAAEYALSNGSPPGNGVRGDPTGDNIFRAVVHGIGKLASDGQTGPYALILSPDLFAEASAPIKTTLVTPADRINPLVTGGFLSSGNLPPGTGLLASLGGEPTTIYIGIDITTAFVHMERDGTYRFRVFEQIQYIARDPSALREIKFNSRSA